MSAVQSSAFGPSVGAGASPAGADVSPHDRLPTFADITTFDAAAAWDRLTVAEQRRIGILAVQFGTIGQITNYVPTDNWPTKYQDRLFDLEDAALADFGTGCEPLWARLFGWITPAASSTTGLQVVS